MEELLRSGIPAVTKVAEKYQTKYLNLYALDQMQRQNYVLALRTFEQAMALCTARSDAEGITLMHNNIGWLHETAGDEVRAIAAYKKALEVVRNNAQLRSWSASSLMSHIGGLFTDLGALDSAQFYLEQGLAGTDSVSFAHDHLCLGQLREAQGRYDEAIRHLTWARDRAEREQNHQLFFASLGTLRRVYTAMNKPELAAAVVEELVARARALGNDQQLSGACCAVASFCARAVRWMPPSKTCVKPYRSHAPTAI
ncbi:MAG: tetratricopeptide repeat protein [Flavobacteriales bacterium]|nr:tetratricopeptide repeat protein [Flavobacteriales bacterium]